MATEAEDPTREHVRVIVWRRRGLRHLGIDRRLATMYAADVDYHDVKQLMDRTGWTAEQAFELLRP